MKQTAFCLLLGLILLGCGAPKEEYQEPQGTFISLSDIHFDPFFDPALYPALAAADADRWEGIFSNSQANPSYLNREHDDDTNHFLLRSTMLDMRSRGFNPSFVVITGDLLLHNMQRHFPAGVTAAERLSFTIKTMDYVYQQLELLYSDIPIFAALGNNDNFSGNYSILPDGDFLKGIANTWYRSLKSSVDSTDFYNNFLRRGNYAAHVPGKDNYKVLSLNTILFYKDYPLTQAAADSVYTQAVEEQFTWMEEELAGAEQNGEKVWLIYHIPPGVDVYKTVNDNALVPNWTQTANSRFLRLVDRYSKVITAQLGGHTHKDSFALINNEQGFPVSYIHTTPSISMSNRNSPVYHHIQLDTGFMIKDFDAYYLKDVQDYATASWEKEYSFNETYNNVSYSTIGLSTLRTRMANESDLVDLYIQYFNGTYYKPSNSPNISQESWKAYWCAMGEQSFEGFERCWK